MVLRTNLGLVWYEVKRPRSFASVAFWLTSLVLFALILFNATMFPPSNWDSMTYHMSRVAFWIQNKSVFPYFTPNLRQVQMTPGAEYLILVEQIFWMSDRFANTIQTLSFLVILFGSIGWLSEWAGHRWSGFAAVAVFLPAPMIILQSQTTQNDLIAAVPVVCAAFFFIERYIVKSKSISSVSPRMVAMI
jgi:hypothetical protein